MFYLIKNRHNIVVKYDGRILDSWVLGSGPDNLFNFIHGFIRDLASFENMHCYLSLEIESLADYWTIGIIMPLRE